MSRRRSQEELCADFAYVKKLPYDKFISLATDCKISYDFFIKYIIVKRGQWNIPIGEYFEMHHIVARCLGGNGDWATNIFRKNSTHSNCIWLYAREHFIAHKLLAKEYSSNGLIVQSYCLMAFCKSKKTFRRFECTPEEYQECKLLSHSIGMSDSSKEKLSLSKMGHTVSQETKNKISQSLKGKCYRTEESERKRLESRFGYRHTEETKRKISEGNKGKKGTRLGVHLTSDTKQKMRDSAKNKKRIKCVELGAIYVSISDASRLTRINRRSISNVLCGRACTAGGYHWEYVED